MNVEIVTFPLTEVAVIEHIGPTELEYQTINQFIAWRKEQNLFDPQINRNYGIHYTDPNTTPPHLQRVDFAISIDKPIGVNRYGVTNKTIPELRCAKAVDIGSRYNNQAIIYLIKQWLPYSGEQLGDFPPIFHYVNVGPDIREEDMITEVYLPLK